MAKINESMNNFFDTLIQQAGELPIIEWVATITALVYVVLAARSNIWCWFWGIISCSLWAYASFTFYQLYLDALLQVFYVIMGGIGIYQWKFGGENKAKLPVTRLKMTQHLYILISGTILALGFGYFFDEYTPAAATYLDAFTTIFAVITTILLVRRILENWIYWVLIDAVYVYLYASRGAFLFALLMVLYTVIAANAFYKWRKEHLESI